jgi:hypothetical protein
MSAAGYKQWSDTHGVWLVIDVSEELTAFCWITDSSSVESRAPHMHHFLGLANSGFVFVIQMCFL